MKRKTPFRTSASGRPTKYHGVTVEQWRGQTIYVAHIINRGHEEFVGAFKTALQAARAYDYEAWIYLGRKAKLNFPVH